MQNSEAEIPLFPLPLVLFPTMPLPLHIFEPRYRKMIHECMAQRSPFGLVYADRNGVAEIGCLAEIRSVLQRFDDGRFDILCFGTRRFSVHEFDTGSETLRASVAFFGDDDDQQYTPDLGSSNENRRELAIAVLTAFSRSNGKKRSRKSLDRLSDEELSFMMAATEVFSLVEKREMLEMRSTETRMELCIDRLQEAREQRKRLGKLQELLSNTSKEELQRLLN